MTTKPTAEERKLLEDIEKEACKRNAEMYGSHCWFCGKPLDTRGDWFNMVMIERPVTKQVSKDGRVTIETTQELTINGVCAKCSKEKQAEGMAFTQDQKAKLSKELGG